MIANIALNNKDKLNANLLPIKSAPNPQTKAPRIAKERESGARLLLIDHKTKKDD